MCSPKPKTSTQQLPSAPSMPPPPEETAQVFSTLKDEENRNAVTKKKNGTQVLRIFDNSVLYIPESSGRGKNSGGIFIP